MKRTRQQMEFQEDMRNNANRKSDVNRRVDASRLYTTYDDDIFETRYEAT